MSKLPDPTVARGLVFPQPQPRPPSRQQLAICLCVVRGATATKHVPQATNTRTVPADGLIALRPLWQLSTKRTPTRACATSCTPAPSRKHRNHRQHRVPKYKKRWEAKVKELEAKEKEVQKLKQLVMQLQEAHDIFYVQDTSFRSLPPQLHSTASRGKDTCVAVALGDLWFTVVCCCALCLWVA